MEEQLVAFLDFLRKEHKYSSNTISAYRNDLNQFWKFLNSSAQKDAENWQEIKMTTIKGYVDYMTQQPYASSSIARKVAAVKSFFNHLHSKGIINENPTTTVDSPKVKKRLPQTLSTEDVDKLLKAPTQKRTPKNLRDTALLAILYATGMRVTEVVSLKKVDVQLEESLLYCGDDSERRELPLDDSTRNILTTYLEDGRPHLLKNNREEVALFLNHRGQQLTRQGLWLIIKAYAKKANLNTAVTPHTLRHSFAAHKLNGGSNLQEVQQLLGHANISTTQIYAQLNDEDDDKQS